MNTAKPMWAVYDGTDHVDVVPTGQSHLLDSGSCWCNPTVTHEHTRPLVVHHVRAHRWIHERCQQCGAEQSRANSDDLCSGPKVSESDSDDETEQEPEQ